MKKVEIKINISTAQQCYIAWGILKGFNQPMGRYADQALRSGEPSAGCIVYGDLFGRMCWFISIEKRKYTLNAVELIEFLFGEKKGLMESS